MARLVALARVPDGGAVDRSTVRWRAHRQEVAGLLRSLWALRDSSGLRMPYTVYTHRLIAQLRVQFDRDGYRLRATTELDRSTVVLAIRVKHRGNRPSR